MDKLRKYIQECWGDIVYSDYDKVATLEDLEYNYRYIRFLLSTEAMFIKWLVENDKIRIPHELDELPAMYWYDYDSVECKADRLVMLLAIKDEPIRFLWGMLK